MQIGYARVTIGDHGARASERASRPSGRSGSARNQRGGSTRRTRKASRQGRRSCLNFAPPSAKPTDISIQVPGSGTTPLALYGVPDEDVT